MTDSGCMLFMGLLLDNEHVCDQQSGGLPRAGGQMTSLSTLPPQTLWKRSDNSPPHNSHRLPLSDGQHLCCSAPPWATPIKAEIWNLLRLLRLFFWDCIIFHCTDEKTQNTKMITALHFTISYNTTRGTGSRNCCQRCFFFFKCFLLGNWQRVVGWIGGLRGQPRGLCGNIRDAGGWKHGTRMRGKTELESDSVYSL